MSATNTIKLPKRFDYSASSEFNAVVNAALNNGENKHIYLDCAQMDYIDSAGIGLLVMAHKRVQASKSSLILINIKPTVKEILMLANLQKLIEFR